MAWLSNLERRLGQLEFLIAMIGLVAIVVATAIAVISRSVFASPVIWTGELSILAQVWLTFIGASAVYKERGHVGMAGLAEALPAGLSRVVLALRDIGLAALLICVGITAFQLMSKQWEQTLSTLGLPRALTSLPVVWSMLSIAASAVLSVFSTPQEAPLSGNAE